MSEENSAPQAPKTVDLSRSRFRSNGRVSTHAALIRRHVQDGCVLASASHMGSGLTATGQAPKVVIAQTFQYDKLKLGSDGLIKAACQRKPNELDDHADNTAQDCNAAVHGILPLSLTPLMLHPSSLQPHPTPEPSPAWNSVPSSSPALAPYPVSTLPVSALPPSLRAHQTARRRRWGPQHPPMLAEGAHGLLSLARQYGACIDRQSPIPTLAPKNAGLKSMARKAHHKSDDLRKPAAAGVYDFLGATIVSKTDLQMAVEWDRQTASTARKCSPPRGSASNARDTAVSKRSIRALGGAKLKGQKRKRLVDLQH